MQSNEIFSCSLPDRRSISMASNSIERSNSAPRSSMSAESGPANSTRISGRSQSRSSGKGGSTVIRYFRRRPAFATTPRRNSLILFAAAILSGIGIENQLSAFSRQLSARIEPAKSQWLTANGLLIFLSRPLLHHLPHLASQRRAVHDDLLHDSNHISHRPVKAQSRGYVPADEPEHHRHEQVHHLLLRRIHSRLRRHALHE